MAIIQCPSCGQGISDQAQQCPKCGVTLQQNGSAVAVDYKGLEWYQWVLFLCVGWIVPLIFHFVYKKQNKPLKAKHSLICFWIDLAWFILVWI